MSFNQVMEALLRSCLSYTYICDEFDCPDGITLSVQKKGIDEARLVAVQNQLKRG